MLSAAPTPLPSGALGRAASRRRGLHESARRIGEIIFGRNPWPGTGVAGGAAAALMLLIALLYLLQAVRVLLAGTAPYATSSDDFLAYLSGAALLARHQAPLLYDPAAQLQQLRALMATTGRTAPSANAYLNPPLLATLLLPLLPLGVQGSGWAWRVLTGLLGAGVLLGVGSRSAARRPGWRRSALLLLSFFPLLQAWQYGEMVSLLLLAFGGWYLLARSGRSGAAGAALSLLLLKPQYAPFLVVYLCWKRQWRQLAGFALAGAAQLALSAGVLLLAGGVPPPTVFRAFATFSAQGTNAWIQEHITLRAAVLLLLPRLPQLEQFALLAFLTLVVTALVLEVLGSRWQTRGPGFAWEVLAVGAATGLTAYHSHMSGLVLLLVPAVDLLAATSDRAGARARAALPVLLALPSASLLLVGGSFWPYVLAGWAVALGSLVLGLAGAAAARRRGGSTADRGNAGADPASRLGWAP